LAKTQDRALSVGLFDLADGGFQIAGAVTCFDSHIFSLDAISMIVLQANKKRK
jgi:hypothetical protein